MEMTYQPVFLKNSPNVICDQILFLVKNSNLNFQLKETPFSLSINLKKCFAQHWNKSSVAESNLFSQPHFPQDGHDHVHQHQQQAVPQPDQQRPADQLQSHQELKQQHALLKKELEASIIDRKEISDDLKSLEKAHKKVVKEKREIEVKHEKVCLSLKDLRREKEDLSKNNSNLSVALQSSKKDLKDNVVHLESKIHNYQEEISNLTKFKITKLDEARKAKKEEKRAMRIKKKAEKSVLENDVEGLETLEPEHGEPEISSEIPVSNFFDCLGSLSEEVPAYLSALPPPSSVPPSTSSPLGSEPKSRVEDKDNSEELKAILIKHFDDFNKSMDANYKKLSNSVDLFGTSFD